MSLKTLDKMKIKGGFFLRSTLSDYMEESDLEAFMKDIYREMIEQFISPEFTIDYGQTKSGEFILVTMKIGSTVHMPRKLVMSTKGTLVVPKVTIRSTQISFNSLCKALKPSRVVLEGEKLENLLKYLKRFNGYSTYVLTSVKFELAITDDELNIRSFHNGQPYDQLKLSLLD